MARCENDSLRVLPGGQRETPMVELGELPPEPQPVWLFWTVMNMLWPAGDVATDPAPATPLPRRRAPRPRSAAGSRSPVTE